MLDVEVLLKSFGYVGLFAIVFAESGLLIGFFLPGDSLLFFAGFLASQGFFSLPVILVGCFIAAVAGDSVGYAFGNRVGPRIFKKQESLLFNKENIRRSEEFYKRHGRKTIILARFIPIVRTFAPILAGVGNMHYRTFLTYNVVGGFLWAVGLTILGYFLGSAIPDIDKYLLPIVGMIIVLSVAPPLIHILKDKSQRTKFVNAFKYQLQKITKKN